MIRPKCEECHYCEWDEDENRGFCHFKPPEFIGRILTYVVVDSTDWCGQYRPALNS